MNISNEVQVERHGHIGHVVMFRPPHNYLDSQLLARLVEALSMLDSDASCRSVVLSSGSDAFCAGANFNDSQNGSDKVPDIAAFYAQAMRLFRNRKPLIAAVEGAAVGAGLALALVADFRVTCTKARFSANFNRLGFHPGFGLTVTLPQLVGAQKAAALFYTGRRVGGEEAVAIGLADALAEPGQVLAAAMAMADDIAASAPLAVTSTRECLREGLADQIAEANRCELLVQREQFRTEDFREGVAAMAAHRAPVFHGR